MAATAVDSFFWGGSWLFFLKQVAGKATGITGDWQGVHDMRVSMLETSKTRKEGGEEPSWSVNPFNRWPGRV